MSRKISTYLIAMLLFLLLVSIRAFENVLFYDPFIAYFHNDFLGSAFPDYDTGKLLLNHLFRYLLNSSLSLLILWVLFKSTSVVKLAGYFLIVAFVVLLGVYYWLLQHSFNTHYMLLFYVRRFLIHPVFVLILIPAFYYQLKLHQKS